MKRLLLALPLLAAGCAEPAADPVPTAGEPSTAGPLARYAPGADRADVLGTVQLLFDALEAGDGDLLRSVMDPSVVMRFAEVRDGVVTQGSSTVAGLAERIESSDTPLVERMWDPVVLVDGPLATVWTPYDFYVGDTFSHCGIDTVHLLRGDTGWSIVGLSWTRLQPPACETHPDGPPTA